MFKQQQHMLKFKTKLSLAVAQRPMYTQGGAFVIPTAHSGEAGVEETPVNHTTLHPFLSILHMCTPLKYL